MKNIVVYEDIFDPWFYPINKLRAVFEIKAGLFSFLERIFFLYPKARYHLFYREHLKSVVRKRYPDFFHNTHNVGLDVLFINGRTVLDAQTKQQIEELKDEEFLLLHDDKVICFRLVGNKIPDFVERGVLQQFSDEYVINFFRSNQGYKVYNSNANRVENIWQIIAENGQTIQLDFELVNKGGLILSKIGTHTALTNEQDIYIGKNCKISPMVHIDASHGPVYIGREVEIKANVLIEGPVFIDNGATIYPGYIREKTSIGENCRIGGEVESSIFLSNTNKYHAGFIGHSYVGEWVNFGAMTTTSDLKNNYKNVSVEIDDVTYNTDTRLLGSIIGDYCKFSIGTMLNTGTICGLAVNIVNSNFSVNNNIPSFSWMVNNKRETYLFDKFLETAKIVLLRREKSFSPEDISLLEYLFNKARVVKKS